MPGKHCVFSWQRLQRQRQESSGRGHRRRSCSQAVTSRESSSSQAWNFSRRVARSPSSRRRWGGGGESHGNFLLFKSRQGPTFRTALRGTRVYDTSLGTFVRGKTLNSGPLAAGPRRSQTPFPGDPKAAAAHLSPWVTERGRRGAGSAGQVGAAGAGGGSKWLGRAQSVLRDAGAGARCAAPSAPLRHPPAARPCLCPWYSRVPAARWRGCLADLRLEVPAPRPPPPRSHHCPRCGHAGPGALCSLQPVPAAPPPLCWPHHPRSRPAVPPRQALRCYPRARSCRSGCCS